MGSSHIGLLARYMEISMYLPICLLARYMEISMYLAMRHMARYMEISMYLAICLIARYMAAQRNMKISVHLNCCIKVHLMNTYHSLLANIYEIQQLTLPEKKLCFYRVKKKHSGNKFNSVN